MSSYLGLRTAIYAVPDIRKAREWYAAVLGVAPYFDQPFYVGFNVGGCELGLNPDLLETTPGAGGTTVYWGVPDCRAEYARLLALGATQQSPPRDVGGGILVGTVVDPFGNVFGIIENPHSVADPN